MLGGIRMELLNLQAQGLSIDVLDYVLCYLIKILLLICNRDVDGLILSMPPALVHQVHLCSAFLTARSLCSSSNVFSIVF